MKRSFRRTKERRARLMLMLGGKCSICGYDRDWRALEFHHRDPDKKRINISKKISGLGDAKFEEDVVYEAQKCILMCANCHKIYHIDEIYK